MFDEYVKFLQHEIGATLSSLPQVKRLERKWWI
jgi:hypothetical protein